MRARQRWSKNNALAEICRGGLGFQLCKSKDILELY